MAGNLHNQPTMPTPNNCYIHLQPSDTTLSRQLKHQPPGDKRNTTSSTHQRALQPMKRKFSKRLVLTPLLAFSLTAATVDITFTKWKRKLSITGENHVRGGGTHIPREFADRQGYNFTLPRGVPVPPPLLSALCAPLKELEECDSFHQADCFWCDSLGSCLSITFSRFKCIEKKEML